MKVEVKRASHYIYRTRCMAKRLHTGAMHGLLVLRLALNNVLVWSVLNMTLYTNLPDGISVSRSLDIGWRATSRCVYGELTPFGNYASDLDLI